MRLNNDDKTVAAMDVLVPKVGELIGGSQREERLDVSLAPSHFCCCALMQLRLEQQARNQGGPAVMAVPMPQVGDPIGGGPARGASEESPCVMLFQAFSVHLPTENPKGTSLRGGQDPLRGLHLLSPHMTPLARSSGQSKSIFPCDATS